MTDRGDRCINPSGVRKEDLMAYAEGDVTSPAKDHIERCPFCQREARAYARMGQIMGVALLRRSCVPSETLGDYALGLLETAQMRDVAEHLLDCPHCLAESRTIAAFLQQPDEPLSQGILGAIRRLIATRPDSPAHPAAALRGAATDEMATFVAEDCVVRLSVQAGTPGRPGKAVAGLFEPRSGIPVEGVARIYDGERLLQTGEVDDLGNFLFTSVLQGTYRIEVTSGETIVVIETMRVD